MVENEIKNKRLMSNMAFNDWRVDIAKPYKCLTGKIGGVTRFETEREALNHFNTTEGRMLVTCFKLNKVKFIAYRWK